MRQSAPKISVLMSVYNGERYLREAIDSVLAQSYSDFEFIIVDDGSTDNTPAILRSYSDPRIRVLHQKNTGIIGALNRGLTLCRESYIARMDADDISEPTRFESQINFLEAHPEVGLVGTAAFLISESGKILTKSDEPIQDSAIRAELRKRNCFWHGSLMFRAECIRMVGGYRAEFKHAEDYDLILRIADRCQLANLPEPLYRYRIASTSITRRYHALMNAAAKFAQIVSEVRRRTGTDPLDGPNRVQFLRLFNRIKREAQTSRGIAKAQWGLAEYYYNIGDLLSTRSLALSSVFRFPFALERWRELPYLTCSPETLHVLRRIKRSLSFAKKFATQAGSEHWSAHERSR